MTVQLRQIGPGMLQQVQAQCGKCEGRGSIIQKGDRCNRCDGAGTVKEAKVFEIVVERGMKDDDKIVHSGEGEQEPDSDPGDLLVIIKLQRHGLFHRQGNHLFLKQTIPLVDALTGFETKIPHLDGHVVHLKSKPGTVIKPGQFKAIRNEGMPYRSNPFKKGTLYVEFDVEFPELIDSKQNELLRQCFGKQSPAKQSLPAAPSAPAASPIGAVGAAGVPVAAGGGKKKKKKKKNPAPEVPGIEPDSADSKMDEDVEEVEMEDVNLDSEKAMWKRERDEEREKQAAQDEDDDEGGGGPRRATCASH